MWINEQTLGTFILHTDIRYECYKDNKLMPAILDDAILAVNAPEPIIYPFDLAGAN